MFLSNTCNELITVDTKSVDTNTTVQELNLNKNELKQLYFWIKTDKMFNLVIIEVLIRQVYHNVNLATNC